MLHSMRVNTKNRRIDVEQDVKRRLLYGLLSLLLGIAATRLALFLTNKLLGQPEQV